MLVRVCVCVCVCVSLCVCVCVCVCVNIHSIHTHYTSALQLFRLLLEALDVRYVMLSPAAISAGKGERGARAVTSAHAVETAVLKALEASSNSIYTY